MRSKIVIALAGLLCGLLLLGGGAWAMSSANYTINWDVIGGGGEPASSANYHMRGTIGQPAAETSSSTNYQLGSGYWHEILAPPGANTLPEVSNVTASQRLGTGIVDISYDVTDAEQFTATISFQYWNGTSWQECATTTGEGSYWVPASVAEGTWDAKTDFDGQYLADCKIKVIADDGQASNNIGEGVSATFALDTRNPTGYGCSTPAKDDIDVSVNASLTALAASDDSPPISYWFILAEDAVFTQGIQESGWQEDDTTWVPPTTLNYEDDYWWKVKVKDTYGNEGDYSAVFKFTTVGPPLEEDNPDVAAGLESISDCLVVVYGFDNATKTWTWYNPSWPPEANTLTTLYMGSGYWINVSEGCDFLTYGANTYELDEGWNLIGWLGYWEQVGANPDVAEGLDNIMDKLEVVYGFYDGMWTWYNPGWPPAANTLTTLYIARGYWVKVCCSCSLEYDTNTYGLDPGWNLIGWLG
jgi:hypothetical protein